MKRDILNQLKTWKDSITRKPLILRGARQVGKSWIAKEFGKSFEIFIELNFDKKDDHLKLFEKEKDPKKLVELISNYTGKKIIPGKTLLFIDEIQNSSDAIGSLRYFYEEMPELHVLAAGSLLEFELRKISLPVGRIQFLHMYPMSFSEFLTASRREDLREMLLNNGINPLAEPINKLLKEFVRTYTIIGGLPEVVNTYLLTKDIRECQNIQSDILITYRKDFNKYAKKHQIKYLEKLFTTIPLQTGTKLKFSNIDPNIRAQTLSEALELLCLAGVVNKVYHSNSNGIPLNAGSDLKKFKTHFFDIGLMLNLLHFDFRPLLLDPDISFINNGILAEQFVFQEFTAYSNPRQECQLFYWHREAKSSNSEVDLVMEFNNSPIPIEIKSGPTGSMKSLNMFLKTKNSPFGFKISPYPFSFSNSVYSIPFYGIESLLKSQEFN